MHMQKKNDGKIIKAEKKQTQKSQSNSFSKSDQITSNPPSPKDLNEPGAAVNSRTIENDENNTAGESSNKFDKLNEEFINDIEKKLEGAAESLYKTIKDKFNIRSSFYVPESAVYDDFQQQMQMILKQILNFILALQNDQSKVKISVSLCFETDTAKRHVNGKEEDTLGVYVPYAFESNYEHLKAHFSGKTLGTGTLKFVVNKKNNGFYKASLRKHPLKTRNNMHHGGIPFSERCIKGIDFKDGKISKVLTYDEICTYMPSDYKERDNLMNYIIDLFNDGSQENYPNELIHQRCQLIVIPLECKRYGKHVRRFGYLQVVGYKFKEGDKWITTDFLGDKNSTKAKFIMSMLKCYARYIVLSDKVESIKKIDTVPLQNLDLTYKKSIE